MAIRELTKEEKELREKILATKKDLKALAAEQKEDRILLSKDHSTLGKDKWGWPTASGIQSRACDRAYKITNLHIEYNKMRGKDWHMHERKRR